MDPHLFFHHTLSRHPNPGAFQLHVHEKYELFLFLRGDAAFFVEGNEYALEPGGLLLMHPGETHRLIVRSDTPYERVVFHFDGALLRDTDPAGMLLLPFQHAPGQQNYFPPGTLEPELLSFFLDQLPCAEQAVVLSPSQELTARVALPALLLSLREKIAQRRSGPEGLAASATAYINRHLTETWALEDLAAQLFVSKAYLNKKFKEATGTTVWQYVIVKRLQNARQRIVSGEPIHTVFDESGFGDYATFFKRYRERFGVSPRADQAAAKAARR